MIHATQPGNSHEPRNIITACGGSATALSPAPPGTQFERSLCGGAFPDFIFNQLYAVQFISYFLVDIAKRGMDKMF